MKIFEEKIEKLLIIDDQSKLDSLSQEVREAVILLYLRELFEKDKEILRAYYPPLNLFFQRDEQGNPTQFPGFELMQEQPSVKNESNQQEEVTEKMTEEKKETVEDQQDQSAEEMNQVIQKALDNKTAEQFKELLYFPKNPPANEVGKNPYLYPYQDGFVLVQGPDHRQIMKTLEAAWLSFGLDDWNGKYSAILNDPELGDLLGDHLANHIDYHKVFDVLKKRVQKTMDKEG